MADIPKRRAVIGDHGSWVQVERIAAEGLQLSQLREHGGGPDALRD